MCPVLAQPLNDLLPPLRELLQSLKGRRFIGHLELTHADNGCVVLIRHLAPFNTDDSALIQAFAAKHNVMLFLAPETDELVQCYGEQPYYDIDGLKLTFSPKDFMQVNGDVNVKMVAQAIEWLDVQPQDRVLDLFCGLGNFSLPLAKRAKAVVGVEGIDDMVLRATDNAQANAQYNATFYQANLEQDVTKLVWAQEQFDKILLDPARAGAAGVMQHVVKLAPNKVVYVSCNPATLARDSQVLLQRLPVRAVGYVGYVPTYGSFRIHGIICKGSKKAEKIVTAIIFIAIK